MIASTFRLHERALRIVTDDRWAVELMTSTYAPMLSENHVRPDEAVSIPKTGRFEPAYYTLRNLFARFSAGTPAHVAVYGASVAVNGRGALIIGPTKIGKSVLALNLAYRGAQFLGDETALIDYAAGTIRAVPRRPALREGALNVLLDAQMCARVAACRQVRRTRRGRFWYGLDYAMLRLALDVGAYPLCAVLFLAERGAEAEIASMPSEAVFPEIARRAHGGVDLMRIANLHAVIRRVRAYRLQAGAPDATADLIMKMMSQ